ncbi:MAG: hypothetical protein RLP44_14935 [Aggregatilineales bacterium]
MGYWGWRPLVFGMCISVLIVGCLPNRTVLPSPAPTQTPFIPIITRPPMTLTPTSTPGIPLITTTPHSETSTTPEVQPEFAPILPLAPTCYTVNISDVLCLGEIKNNSTMTLQNMILDTTFYDPAGNFLLSQQVAILQHSLPPQQHAPYHLLLTESAGVDLRQLASLNLTISATERKPSNTRPLIRLENVDSEWRDDKYVISATLFNPTRQDAHNVQMIACVYDSAGRLVGYRILSVPVVLGGARNVQEIHITPLVVEADLTYTLDVVTE